MYRTQRAYLLGTTGMSRRAEAEAYSSGRLPNRPNTPDGSVFINCGASGNGGSAMHIDGVRNVTVVGFNAEDSSTAVSAKDAHGLTVVGLKHHR
jgi:hypothetical protein